MPRLEIQAAIKTILEEVPNIGKVYDSIRWTNDQGNFITAFAEDIDGQNQIRSWMIYRSGGGFDYGSRENSLGTEIAIPIKSKLARYDFKIEGWASFRDDDTDIEFQALLDTLEAKFEANISLNQTALIRSAITYEIDHQFFGDYFVHHVILSFYAVPSIKGITPL